MTIKGFTSSNHELDEAKALCEEKLCNCLEGHKTFKLCNDIIITVAAILLTTWSWSRRYIVVQKVLGLSAKLKQAGILLEMMGRLGLPVRGLIYTAVAWLSIALAVYAASWAAWIITHAVIPKRIKEQYKMYRKWQKWEKQLKGLCMMFDLCAELEMAAGKVSVSDDKKTIVYIVPGDRSNTDIRMIKQFDMTKRQQKRLLKEVDGISFAEYDCELTALLQKIFQEKDN